jgi:membrane protease YdiL (CAAX protease family)
MRDVLESSKVEGQPAGPEPAMPESFSYSVAAGMAAGHVGTLVFTLVALRYGTGRDWRRIVALRRPRIQHMLLAVLLLPGMMLTHSSVHLLLALMFDIDPNEGEAGLESMVSPWPMWVAVLLLGVGPGVIEELFCRGFLGRGLLARYGYPLGIVLTSIFFGLLHLAPLYAIGTAVMGVMLHLTYVYTRSLWVPIFLHFANNTIPALALTGGPTPPGAEQAATEVSWVSYLTAVVLTVVGLATLWTARARLVAVDESGSPDPEQVPWRPRYPGLELPPPGSGTVLRSNWANPVLFLLTCLCFGGLVYSFSVN